jgi:hypothetical protein
MNTLPHIEETPFTPRVLQGAASTFKFVPVADLECREPEFTVDGLIET